MYSFLCCMMWLPPISPLTVSLFPTTALFRLLPRQRPVGRIGGGHIGKVRHGERRRGRGCSSPPERVIVLARRLALQFERHHARRRVERPPRDDRRLARKAKLGAAERKAITGVKIGSASCRDRVCEYVYL